MAEKEENVFMAKLAEQAERYDGKCLHSAILYRSTLRLYGLNDFQLLRSLVSFNISHSCRTLFVIYIFNSYSLTHSLFCVP